MGQVYWYLYNVAIAMVVVVFDEQLSEFGVLVVDSNGKASIVAGADEIVDYFPEVLFFLFILLGDLIAVKKLNIINGINRFILQKSRQDRTTDHGSTSPQTALPTSEQSAVRRYPHFTYILIVMYTAPYLSLFFSFFFFFT